EPVVRPSEPGRGARGRCGRLAARPEQRTPRHRLDRACGRTRERGSPVAGAGRRASRNDGPASTSNTASQITSAPRDPRAADLPQAQGTAPSLGDEDTAQRTSAHPGEDETMTRTTALPRAFTLWAAFTALGAASCRAQHPSFDGTYAVTVGGGAVAIAIRTLPSGEVHGWMRGS